MFQNAFTYSRTTRQKGIAVLLALLFVVAAGRQLIPGLCTTLLQVEAQILPKTSGAVYADCCTHVPRDTNEDSGISWNNIPSQIPPCPFCSLIAVSGSGLNSHTETSSLYPEDVAIRHRSKLIKNSLSNDTQSRRGPPFPV